MSKQWPDAQIRRGLSGGTIEPARVGRVDEGPGTHEPYLLRDPHRSVVTEVSSWMRYLVVADHSTRTIRSYCYASLTWFRILWMLDVA